MVEENRPDRGQAAAPSRALETVLADTMEAAAGYLAVQAGPVAGAITGGRETPLETVTRFWADGLAAFLYALGLYGSLGIGIRLRGPDLRPGLWRSIREDLRDEPGLAAPFLQLLAGERPNWRSWTVA